MKPRYIAASTALVGVGLALFFAFQPRRRALETRGCQSNLKQIGLASLQYVRDYDEKTPPAARWNQVLRPYLHGYGAFKKSEAEVTRIFDCPLESTGYALNRFYADGLPFTLAEPAATSPVVFDSTLRTSNAADFGASWPRDGVHQFGRRWGNNALFADGHVKLMARKATFRPFVKAPKPRARRTSKLGS